MSSHNGVVSRLEGDLVLVLNFQRKVNVLFHSFSQHHHPNVQILSINGQYPVIQNYSPFSQIRSTQHGLVSSKLLDGGVWPCSKGEFLLNYLMAGYGLAPKMMIRNVQMLHTSLILGLNRTLASRSLSTARSLFMRCTPTFKSYSTSPSNL